MRFILLFVFSVLTFTASAQFWKKKKPDPEPVRYDLLDNATANFLVPVSYANLQMPAVIIIPQRFKVADIITAEDVVLKEVKHYMRYRMYREASNSFSMLAKLYIMQNRFSEAKWYLLQSNEISRQQNNYELTITNLLDLAAIKLAIGEPALAKVDLQEAHALASATGFTGDAAAIEKRIQELQLTRQPSVKPSLRYAEAVELTNKSH